MTLVASTTAHAQRYIDIQLQASEISYDNINFYPITPSQAVIYDGATIHYFKIQVKNLGPFALLPNDSICVKIGSGLKKYLLNTQNLPPGDSMEVALQPAGSGIGFIFNSPFNVTTSYVDTVNWCDSVWVAGSTANGTIIDLFMNNNRLCAPVAIHYALTEINSVLKLNLRIFPNPAKDQLTIEGGEAGMKLTILNTIGQQVYSGVLSRSREVVNISKLAPGNYILQLTDMGGIRNTVKLVKQ